jgi:hypothetical protein
MAAFGNTSTLCVTAMKLKFALLFIIVTFQFIGTSNGQVNAKVDAVVEALKRINVDTLIFCSSPQVSKSRFFHGLGYVTFLELWYIFYQKDGESFAKQIVEYCNDDCSKMKSAVSHPIKLEDPALFAFTRANLAIIQYEEIRPYTYKVLDTLTGEEYYQTAGSYHTTYHINVITGTQKIEKSVNIFDFEKLVSKGYAPNLNYGYNTKTQLKGLVDILMKFSDSLQNQFKF